MPDEAKLTLESALAEFPEECEILMGGGYIDLWKQHGLSSRIPRLDLDLLLAAALRWLFARNMWMPAVPVHPEHRDPLRWLLLEVRAQLKQENEESHKRADGTFMGTFEGG